MKNPRFLRLFPALGLLAALGSATLPEHPALRAQDRTGQEVDKLIKQLGDRRPAVREAATRRLRDLEGADPALRAARKSSDPEVARRATLILAERRRLDDRKALERLKEYAKNREVDRAVELFVQRPKWDDDMVCWQVLGGLAADLIERGRKEFGVAVPPPQNYLPVGDLSRYLQVARPLFLAGPHIDFSEVRRADRGTHLGVAVRGTDLVFKGGGNIDGALVAATGTVGPAKQNHFHWSVVYAGAPVELEGVSLSVLVCDGDLRVSTIWNSLVIVRGDVYCAAGISNSLVVMTGRLHLREWVEKEYLGDKLISRKRASAKIHKSAKVRERQSDLLGLVKFFEPAHAGLEVEPAKGGVRVKAVDAAKAFAKAGLRTGDVITAVDGQASADPEAFRRQLRSALARDSFAFQLKRNGASRQLQIDARPK